MAAGFIALNLCIFLAILRPVISSAGSSGSASGASSPSTTVKRKSSAGDLTGVKLTVLKKAIENYQSIPYAEPPLGTNRFKRTIAKKSWTGVLDATKKPNSCIQNLFPASNFAGVDMWNPTTNISEDCLYLNVWTPVASGQTGSKAVMIFIHGGAYIGGSTTIPMYDGATIAATADVVVVTINYRLAVLGFYFLDTIDAPGNMGLIDQNTAIQWVVNNIASFGGNPKRITIFGESAGSISTSFHLFSEISRDLFQYAIMESGSCLQSSTFRQPDEVKSYSLKLADIVGCDSKKAPADVVACLQKLDAAKLNSQMYAVNNPPGGTDRFSPTVDGYFLTATPEEYVAKGSYKKGNILAGVNQAEGTYLVMYPKSLVPPVFDFAVTDPITLDQLNTTVETTLSTESAAVRKAVRFFYSTVDDFGTTPTDKVSLFNAYSIVGDHLIACSLVSLVEAYASFGQIVYAYLFDHKASANPWPEWMGAMHTGELDYVFGKPLVDTSGSYTAAEKGLSRRIIQHWANFAKTGNPNTGEDGETASYSPIYAYNWPVYTHADKKYQLLEIESNGIEQGLLYHRCQFWNTYLPELRAEISSQS